MRHRDKYKAKITEWKNNIFTTVEKLFEKEEDAKKETEKYSGKGKVYNEEGHPVYYKPEKLSHPEHPNHPYSYC
jgi:hypothetical protein